MGNTSLKQTSHAAAAQTYRFEFGSDDKVYSISFKGSISEPEIHGVLESVHNTLFENCGEAIRFYLDSNHLDYSNFSACEKKMRHGRTMGFAKRLLHHPSCKAIDKWVKNTGFYFCAMDYLGWMEDCSVGSYCVVARIPSSHNNTYKYYAISQTFDHTAYSNEERSHFAIRRDDGEESLITLDEESNSPVLATFGCVDLLNLLINITDITTKQQAAELANK